MENKKRPTIAIITGNTSSDYCTELMAGFRACARAEDVNLVFLTGPHIPRHCKDVLYGSFAWSFDYQFHTIYDYVHYIQPDAIIVAYGSLSQFKHVPDVDEFVAGFKGIPTLVLGDRVKDPEIPYLIGGNYNGMVAVVRHLVEEHGFRKLAFLAGPERNFDSTNRLRAFRDVLEEHGIPFTDSMVAYGNYSENVDSEVEELLDNNPGIEALVCANDNMAKCAYKVCAARNIDVGRDIAITGFDDADTAKRLSPPLTSVAHSSFMFSYEAVKAALELCNGRVPQSKEMDAIFKRRSSCGCTVIDDTFTGERQLEELDRFIENSAHFITEELFSSIPYATDKIHFESVMRGFFTNSAKYTFEGLHQSGGGNVNLKLLCQHPFVSKRLLLEYIEKTLYCYREFTDNEEHHGRVSHILKTVRQYIHAHEVGDLQQENMERERKLWFTPTFTADLINANLDMRDQLRYLLNRLKSMGIKSAYMFFFMKDVPHKEGEKFKAPEDIYLTAYFDEKETVCYKPEEMVCVKKNGQGIHDILPQDEARFYTSYVLFSAESIYGMIMCEVEQKDFSFMLTCSMQLGSLRRVIDMNIRERAMQRELEEKNRILSFVSEYDELSQLLNRRGFMERAIPLLKKAKGKKAVMVFADVDHLKEINDTFGHSAGDFAIVTASDYLRKCMPEGAITARIGGDEYVSLFVSQEENSDEVISKRIKAHAAEFNAKSDKPYYVEMSAGAYEFICGKGTDIAEVLKKSDEVLYEHKRNRRASIKK